MNKATLLNAGSWMLALGAFSLAMFLSYREVHNRIPNDLRSPLMLLVNTLLASAVSFVYALRERSLKSWVDVHLCLRFGFWTAAVFRLVPPFLQENVLFMKNCFTFDAPYIILGAFIHGGLAFLLASLFAFHGPERLPWSPGGNFSEMSGIAILVLFFAAIIVRLLAETAFFN